VLVGALGGRISRYDLQTLEPVAELPGTRGQVERLEFSNDGTTLAASSADPAVSIYDVATGLRLGDPIPSDTAETPVGFLRHDGKAVAVTMAGGIAIWDLDQATLRTAACQLAGRNLTESEWTTYLGRLGPYVATCDAVV
jgi:hypothetical protein